MELEVGKKIDMEMDEGVMIDFVDDEWLLLIKDGLWTDYEKKALRRNKLTLSFVEKGIVDLFLIQVEDALETSDCPFDVHVADYSSCFKTFKKGEGYSFNIAYLDLENIVVANRKVRLNTEMSNCISEHLKKQSEIAVDEDAFERGLAKLQGQYEPFECEEFALAFNQF